MPTARMIAQRCAARLVLWHDDDPASILTVLQEIEFELIALGGTPDPELAEAGGLVSAAFPGAPPARIGRDGGGSDISGIVSIGRR